MIGGFFELELPDLGRAFHMEALALTNGRSCVRWILERERPQRVYVPFYSCEALYEPIKEMGIRYEYYSIDEKLNPIDLPIPENNELLICINYFGLKNDEMFKLSERYGNKIVIDDTHRFFHRGYPGSYSFTSARKYFGVPDGAYLYGAKNVEIEKISRFDRVSLAHSFARLIGKQDEAYENFIKYEASLRAGVERISIISERLLNCVDYPKVMERRLGNFQYLDEIFASQNTLDFDVDAIDAPFCYPLLPRVAVDKKKLYKELIFVPTLWPDIFDRKCKKYACEYDMADRLLPLPIDHRYDRQDMQRMAEILTKLI